MRYKPMKNLSLALLALVVASLPLRADDWSKTYTLTGKPDLRVETSDANIRVSTWDQNTIEAHVSTAHYKIGEGGIRIEEHQNGDAVEIAVRYPHHDIHFGFNVHSYKVEIEIRMPREGKVNLNTGDGRIDLSGFKGEMALHSGDGSLNLDSVDGKLRAGTSDGHIRANGRFDELEVKTGDGTVEVRAANGSTVTPDWRLETGDGSVTLEVPANLSADVDLHTGDGHIDLDIPVTAEGKLRENGIHGKINGGGNLMTIRSGDGSIHLRKS